MEEKIIVTNEINEKHLIDTYLLFEYKCINRTQQGSKITLTFQRDDSVPYIEELRKLEREYGSYHIGSLLPGLILPPISFILFTVFLITIFVKTGMSIFVTVPAFVIPAVILLVIAVVFMLLRMKTVNKIASEKPNKDLEYKKKIENLKNKK